MTLLGRLGVHIVLPFGGLWLSLISLWIPFTQPLIYRPVATDCIATVMDYIGINTLFIIENTYANENPIKLPSRKGKAAAVSIVKVKVVLVTSVVVVVLTVLIMAVRWVKS